MGLPLPEPVKVSPVIKLCRWSLLAVGVVYGFQRKARLAKSEVIVREHEKQLKMARDAKIAAERQIASERDVAMLAALADPPPKPIYDD